MALNYCGVDPLRGKSILFGPAYTGNKTVLLQGIKDITHAAEVALKAHEECPGMRVRLAHVFTGVHLFIESSC